MITAQLDNPELLKTLELAVRTLARAQGARITVEEGQQAFLSVWVELPEGYEYAHGHTGFGYDNSREGVSQLDVWHDVLVGICYPVWPSIDEGLCENCAS